MRYLTTSVNGVKLNCEGMLGIKLLIFVSLAVASLSEKLYNEKYRPQLRYSPPKGWMNDPNGLVYHDGLFHLFYQHTPNSTVFGPVHWGHAVSPDLIHWSTLPIALHPERGNYIFSGGALMDLNNVTGLATSNSSQKTLITIFTAHAAASGEQKQWMAYSNDAPLYKHFNFYRNNPIIANPDPSRLKDFRDPQVFQYKDHFVLLLAAFNRTLIYNSRDLIEWRLVSEFGEREGSHIGVWECPSLFPINVTVEGKSIEKWVLIVSVGPNMQYFIGSFDGMTFTNENSKAAELWIDYGPDSYAGITYNLLPDGRRIFISWMNRWEYATSLNFSIWNGQMGIARELKLIAHTNNQFLLSSLPVRELESLRVKRVHHIKNTSVESNFALKMERLSRGNDRHLLDIEMTVDLVRFRTNDTLGIEFTNSKQKLSVFFTGNEFVLDRTHAGRKDFNPPNYGLVWKAARMLSTRHLKLRIIIDRSSIEVFADDGLSVMAALYYSDEDLASAINITVKGQSVINLMELNVHQLKSIWNS